MLSTAFARGLADSGVSSVVAREVDAYDLLPMRPGSNPVELTGSLSHDLAFQFSNGNAPGMAA
jgi:hypothetical protein